MNTTGVCFLAGTVIQIAGVAVRWVSCLVEWMGRIRGVGISNLKVRLNRVEASCSDGNIGW